MNEQRTRTMARAVLDEYERRVDVAAGLEAVRTRAATTPPVRRWMMAAVAAAAVLSVAASVAVIVAGGDRGAVRTVDTGVTDTETDTTTVVDSPKPVPTTTEASSSVAASIERDLGDLLGDAAFVASTPNGILLSEDGTNWFPSPDGSPASGPAYLIDGYVVTQSADDWGQGSTNGPITIIDADGARAWVSPKPELGGDPVTSGHQLHGVGWMGGRPMFVVSQFERASPGDAYHLLLLVDLHDGTITNLGDFGGWEAAVRGATLHHDRVVVLRSVLTDHWIRVIDGHGATLLDHELTEDAAWSLSGDANHAWVFGGRWDDITGPSIEVVTVDPVTLELDERTVEVADDYDELTSPCTWQRIDGDALECTHTSGPVRVDLTSQQIASIPAPPEAITVNRRVEPPASADDAVVAPPMRASCDRPGQPIAMPNAVTSGAVTMYAARHDDGLVGVEVQRSGITIGGGCADGWDLLRDDGIVLTVVGHSGDTTIVGVAYPSDQPFSAALWMGEPTFQQSIGGDLDATVAVFEIPDSVVIPDPTEEQPFVWTVLHARAGTLAFAALDPDDFTHPLRGDPEEPGA